MTFKFEPEEWLSGEGQKRLSTCYGKYSKEPYCITTEELYRHFFKLCPHRVYLNASPLVDLFRHSSLEHFGNPQYDRRAWLNANCKGYWYDLSERELDKRKKSNARKVLIFQHEADAMHFKLVWT